MTNRLLWKLLGINVLVIVVVILIVWLAIDYLASDYFMKLMKDYNISPTEVHEMFLAATHQALLWASFATLALAAILSVLLMKKVLHPLTDMIGVTRRISSGDYSARVQVSSRDELAQMAVSFNRMAESLQKIEQLRKKMVVDVAHELRTPLTNMRGYLEALRDGVMSPSKATLDSLHEEVLRLAKLVEDLLQLTRADAAKTSLNPQEISLRKELTKSLDRFQPQFHEKKIHVETTFPADFDRIKADPEKLSQVLGNLLQNACQYTLPGGTVRIIVEPGSGSVKFVFSNPGEGIDPEDLPYIFERFYRSEKSRSREHGGAGIGLAIVKELIEAHGGQVGAESSPGQTHVWFSLPA
jgi:signal transduction histidine kinase